MVDRLTNVGLIFSESINSMLGRKLKFNRCQLTQAFFRWIHVTGPADTCASEWTLPTVAEPQQNGITANWGLKM